MRTFSDFFSSFSGLDWLAIIVGTLALMVFGALWFGVVFRKQWGSAIGMSADGDGPNMVKPLVLTAIYLLLFNIGIAYLSPETGMESALVAGVLVVVLLVFPVLYSGVVWGTDKTTRFLLSAAHWYLAAVIAFMVQGLFS